MNVTNIYASNVSALNSTSAGGIAMGIELGDGATDTINATFAFGTVSVLRVLVYLIFHLILVAR